MSNQILALTRHVYDVPWGTFPIFFFHLLHHLSFHKPRKVFRVPGNADVREFACIINYAKLPPKYNRNNHYHDFSVFTRFVLLLLYINISESIILSSPLCASLLHNLFGLCRFLRKFELLRVELMIKLPCSWGNVCPPRKKSSDLERFAVIFRRVSVIGEKFFNMLLFKLSCCGCCLKFATR